MVTGNRSEYLMALEVTKKATLIIQTGNLINEYEGSNLLDELREKAARHSGELNLAREKYKENHALELR